MEVPARSMSHFPLRNCLELDSSPVGRIPAFVVSEIGSHARLRFPHLTVLMRVGMSDGFLYPLFNSCHPTTPYTSRTLALYCRKEFLKLCE